MMPGASAVASGSLRHGCLESHCTAQASGIDGHRLGSSRSFGFDHPDIEGRYGYNASNEHLQNSGTGRDRRTLRSGRTSARLGPVPPEKSIVTWHQGVVPPENLIGVSSWLGDLIMVEHRIAKESHSRDPPQSNRSRGDKFQRVRSIRAQSENPSILHPPLLRRRRAGQKTTYSRVLAADVLRAAEVCVLGRDIDPVELRKTALSQH